MIAGSLDQLGTRGRARLDERACRAARVGLERGQVARAQVAARSLLGLELGLELGLGLGLELGLGLGLRLALG